uniref:Uncharacterized protein n=1 Tax=Anguilla anguilla TaxID=7936 RepID=A0A0E9WDF5_ANGAN
MCRLSVAAFPIQNNKISTSRATFCRITFSSFRQ